MSRTRRNFSAKFKSELVIELLKEEKDLNTIATENNIQPKSSQQLKEGVYSGKKNKKLWNRCFKNNSNVVCCRFTY